VDQAFEWTQLSAQERTDILASYHSAGIVIMASAFGSTDTPTTDGVDPVAAAMSVADFVIEFDLDGIDVDYEDTTALFSGGAVDWLIAFTQTLRAALPADSLMSHARKPLLLLLFSYISLLITLFAAQGPHFGPNFLDGGYLAVDAAVGPLIDWYNVQFYNRKPELCTTLLFSLNFHVLPEGVTEYVDCPGLLTQSSSNNPRTSVFEIAASGVPLQKIVIGKPASVADANNGFMPTDVLAQCVAQAKGMEWSAGAMLFQVCIALAYSLRGRSLMALSRSVFHRTRYLDRNSPRNLFPDTAYPRMRRAQEEEGTRGYFIHSQKRVFGTISHLHTFLQFFLASA
jgi:hypothetical protein